MCANWGYDRLAQALARRVDRRDEGRRRADRAHPLPRRRAQPAAPRHRARRRDRRRAAARSTSSSSATRSTATTAASPRCVAAGDNGTRELLEDILDGEEEHADWLETQLELVRQVGEQLPRRADPRLMPEYQTPEWHPAFEEYCETIFELGEDDVDLIQARIAERLGVSRPAVSEMVRRMQAEGLVAPREPRSRSPRPERGWPNGSCAVTGWRSGSSPTSSASPGRRRTAKRAVGSTSSPNRSRRRWRGCSTTRPPARTATRFPVRVTGRRPRSRSRASASAPASPSIASPKSSSSRPACSSTSRTRRSNPGTRARSPRRRPTAPSPWKWKAVTWASAPSPGNGSSSPPDAGRPGRFCGPSVSVGGAHRPMK